QLAQQVQAEQPSFGAHDGDLMDRPRLHQVDHLGATDARRDRDEAAVYVKRQDALPRGTRKQPAAENAIGERTEKLLAVVDHQHNLRVGALERAHRIANGLVLANAAIFEIRHAFTSRAGMPSRREPAACDRTTTAPMPTTMSSPKLTWSRTRQPSP